ncbi:MAG: hypothetical protein HYT34_01125 [Candidatus Ryanbacteria bacterium]|nr:hypothetical protein [Candidatus Ryanbacteria bacterium]
MSISKKSSPSKITETTSVIAHQLKTPLSGIKSSLEVLLSEDLGSLTRQQREYLELTLASTEKMIFLVKNLLDAARIDEKRLQLNVSNADLVDIVKGVVEDFLTLARAKNSTIVFKVVGEIPFLTIDAIKIQQVINNILYNAIRYNKGKGLITVILKHEGKFIKFSCQDSGIGISDTEKKKVFSKFYRSPRVVELATEGSGLGLFIAKAIIEQSGGKIWFESNEGEGSTFYFTLPVT